MKKSIWFRILACVLTLAMLVSFAACGADREEEDEDEDEENESGLSFFSGKDAIESYNAGVQYVAARNEKEAADAFEEAYRAAKKSLTLSKEDKCVITEAYIRYTLVWRGEYTAAVELIEETEWVDGAGVTAAERKAALYACDSKLGMFVVGGVVEFGARSAPIEWVVIDVVEEKINGKKCKVATLITKNVEENPAGWGKSGGYMVSNLAGTCENNFKATMDSTLSDDEKKSIVKTTITLPEGGEAQVTYYAPSKADIEVMLANDALKEYVVAPPSAFAKRLGVAPATVGSDGANYFLRDLGQKVDGVQYVCGVTGDGEISEKFGMDTTRNIGTRICVCVDLG